MEAKTQQAPGAEAHREPRIWAVGGGKGGVGKSFITANLGVLLGKHGKKVVLVDLDLGGANMHTCMGLTGKERNLVDYLSDNTANINEYVTMTASERVGLIHGATDNLQIANLKYFQKAKLIRNLKSIEADYVILDLGAGTAFNTLDFFVQAERGIISVTPDPASIENTYRFLKCVFVRRINSSPAETKKRINKALVERQRSTGGKIRTIAQVLAMMDELHPEHAPTLRKNLASTKLHLIVNQAIEPTDTELGPAMQMTCSRYFDTNLDYMGSLQHDSRVIRSLRQRKPFVSLYPQSMIAVYLDRMAGNLIAQDAGKRSEHFA